MRIAVLLYGHLRDFNNCATGLRNHLINKYHCDVFIHTWDETEPSTFAWHKGRSKKKAVDDKVKKQIDDLYSPLKIAIEHQEKWSNEAIIESKYMKGFRFSTAGVHFMFHSMSKANQLRTQFESENGFNYDLVVVTRPDVQLKNDLDVIKIIEQAKVLELDLGKCRFFASSPITMSYSAAFYTNEPNDLLFLGTPKVINTYIHENLSLEHKFLVNHTINVVSNFTAKELKAGIIPIPLSYSLGVDWNFSKYRKECFHFPFMKQWLIKIAIFLLRPFYKIINKQPQVLYYNDCH